MNDLQIFQNNQFGEIRTLEENGAVLFCGIDVARALGYSNPRDAIARHCKGVVQDIREWQKIHDEKHEGLLERVIKAETRIDALEQKE